MHKYNAHGATDVTGFGLLGHAQNLAKNQKHEVSFVIHNLPIIAKMAAVAKACGNMFHLLQVRNADSLSEPFFSPFSTFVAFLGLSYTKKKSREDNKTKYSGARGKEGEICVSAGGGLY